MHFSLQDFLVNFVSIVWEAMPFIVIGAILSGAMEELLPQQFFHRLMPKNRTLAIVLSSLMGFLLPMCECGIVPVMRRLLRKGIPASCAVTYMLSAPVLNPVVLGSTALAFWGFYNVLGVPGLGMVLLRGGVAMITAVTIGHIIEFLDRRGVPIVKDAVPRDRLIQTTESQRLHDEIDTEESKGDHHHDHHDHEHDHHEHHDHDHDECCGEDCGHDHHHHHEQEHDKKPRSLLDRLTAIADIALGDFLDIAAFLIVGAALAALVNTVFSREALDDLANYDTLSIVGMMVMAILLSLCSEADAFVAANFTSLTTGAKLAFLTLGPMFDIKLLIMYRWVFTNRAIRVFVPVMFVMIFLLCKGVDLLGISAVGSASAASVATGP